MQSLKLKSRVDAEGILHLQLPPELANRELELIVVYQSIEKKTGRGNSIRAVNLLKTH